jgi:hypothetical protein
MENDQKTKRANSASKDDEVATSKCKAAGCGCPQFLQNPLVSTECLRCKHGFANHT